MLATRVPARDPPFHIRPLVADLLGAARRNPTITDAQRELLPWALATVSAHSIGALGLLGRAAYSGPGATALVGNLGHSGHGPAFACELVTAAAHVYRGWPSIDGAAESATSSRKRRASTSA